MREYEVTVSSDWENVIHLCLDCRRRVDCPQSYYVCPRVECEDYERQDWAKEFKQACLCGESEVDE